MQDDLNTEWNFERPPAHDEISPENAARAEAFKNAMEDAPAFAGENAENNFADATAIISYGANEAAREYGVEHVVNAINEFNPDNSEDPINDLLKSIGINSKEERADARETNSDERAFLDDNSNPNASKNISRENAVQAIKDFQNMIRTVKADSERFGSLNDDAMDSGRGVFERAAEQQVEETGKSEDLVTMFKGLENQGRDSEDDIPQNPEEETSENDDTAVSLEDLQKMAKSSDEIDKDKII